MHPSCGYPSSGVLCCPGVVDYSYDAEPGTLATIREKGLITINALPVQGSWKDLF